MTIQFTDGEKSWLRAVAAMELKQNPPYGNHHITAARKIVAQLEVASGGK